VARQIPHFVFDSAQTRGLLWNKEASSIKGEQSATQVSLKSHLPAPSFTSEVQRMTTQRARSPRDGSKIDLQSLHARYNQVTQIAQCLRISIESEAGFIEPAAVCRAIVDMLDDINSDLWTFLEPALFHKIEAKETARKIAMLRRRAHVSLDATRDTNGLHHDASALNGNGTDRAMTEGAAH
jgi:hypothetical protein